jgi:3-polyprenyl-4-hydroxybenzoate decarboxylase
LRIEQLDEGVGRIVKGVNTTVDVGVDQTRIEAAKFGNKVDKDGRPPTLTSSTKGKSTNVMFNLGMVKEQRYTAAEWAIMEGGHTLEEPQPKAPGRIFTALENFADGKKKGKSRPGRVKRSGASCKGSVTDLRKRAKKYSGERGRMYHWCANMKGGKKK